MMILDTLTDNFKWIENSFWNPNLGLCLTIHVKVREIQIKKLFFFYFLTDCLAKIYPCWSYVRKTEF